MPHQSDVAFMNFFMPTINPANVAEFLSFAEWGYALSRFSGMWVGFKAISETVESGMSFELPKPRSFAAPDYEPPKSGLHYRWPDLPGPQIEERMEAKKAAVLAFARANPIDRSAWGHDAHFGIVTTGKSHLDVLEALRLLGIDEARAAEANAMWADEANQSKMLPVIAKDAGMDEAATAETMATFVFPTAEDQLSAKWLGGGAADFSRKSSAPARIA